MVYRLKKDNVEKVVVDEDYKQRLVNDGWKELVDNIKGEDVVNELNLLTIEQLKEVAIEKGIEIPSKAKKDEIITMLEDAE